MTQKPVTYLGHSDLQYYKGLATKIDFANCPDPDNPVAYASQEPRRIRHLRKDRIWDLTLSEAIHIALKNNKIIRTREQINFPRNPLVQNPDQIPSVFDPAMQETGVLFGQRSVEAALSDFDAQFSTSLEWNHNAQIENNEGLTAVPLVNGLPTLIQDQGTFKARLDKTFADSSEISFINEWDYLQNNVTGNLFPSVYTGFVRAEYRRPLLAGSGTDYTRIAGPLSKSFQGVANSVVIARINSDIAIADFEAAVHALVRDVQTVYWDLSLAYTAYDTGGPIAKTCSTPGGSSSRRPSRASKKGTAPDGARLSTTISRRRAGLRTLSPTCTRSKSNFAGCSGSPSTMAA